MMKLNSTYYQTLGTKNGLDMTMGEPADFNPSGFENCSALHSHIRCYITVFGFKNGNNYVVKKYEKTTWKREITAT